MQSPATVLSAVTIAMVTAPGISGCGADAPPAPSARSTPEISSSAVPAAAPLPAPDELTSVLYRLADTSVPAEQKVGLVQYATDDDLPALANFGEALLAGGFDPLTVQATDVVWAGDFGHVTANISMGSPNPRVKPFTYPMEFSPLRTTWQLSRRSADQLLSLVPTAPRTR